MKAVEVSIKPMRLSDERCDYFVSFKCGDREVTPHVFRERFKAEYHVAEYRWLFGQGPKPGVMEFRQDEWPVREFTAEEQRAFATHPEGVKALEFYADPANWIDTPSWDGDPTCFTPKAIPVTREEDGSQPCDCGDIARAALATLSHPEPVAQEAAALPHLDMGEFKPCIVINEEVGLTEAIFEDTAYIAEPVFPGAYHWIDKHIAVEDGRLVGLTVWKAAPSEATSA